MVSTPLVSQELKAFSLEDYMLNPPDYMEWVDGQLLEKTRMSAKHGRIQARLARYWGNYKDERGQGGEDILGCSVDLGTQDALRKHLREPVLKDVIRAL